MMAEENHDAGSWRMQSMPAMDNALFSQWVELIQTRTGIRLPDTRRSFLLSSLSIRMRELNIDEYEQYYQYVTNGKQGLIEWETLVDRLTVHETRFWRDERCLELLRDRYINRLSEKQDALKIWSVGCATGEEPYTIAIWLDSLLAGGTMFENFEVHATDISLASLSIARQGRYPANRMTNVPPLFMQTYFTEQPGGQYVVKDRIKERVCFTKLNLLAADTFPFSGIDVIVCQNVLIYFEQALRRKILDSLVNHLRIGGMLILGAGEVTNWANEQLEPVRYDGALAFQRIIHNGQMQ